jgi:cell division septation protein DedD
VPKNDDGEFELILGNRQLLSVFFIVVILLGVFFTMGYIVGRNSAPVLQEAARPAAEPVPAAEPPKQASEAAKVPEQTPPTETTAQLPAEERAPEREPAPAKAEAKAETKKERASKSKAVPVSNTPIAGQTYLQLAATTKHEADIMVDVLRNKGFKALTTEIAEKRGTFRVLVGPIPENGTNKMRADLQASGFPGNAAIRRTF